MRGTRCYLMVAIATLLFAFPGFPGLNFPGFPGYSSLYSGESVDDANRLSDGEALLILRDNLLYVRKMLISMKKYRNNDDKFPKIYKKTTRYVLELAGFSQILYDRMMIRDDKQFQKDVTCLGLQSTIPYPNLLNSNQESS